MWSLGGRLGYEDQGQTPSTQMAVMEFGDVLLVFEVRGLVGKDKALPQRVQNECYTSEGRIAQYDLLVLDDPKRAIPPYDAILLLAPGRAGDEKFVAALTPLIGAIDVKRMREANLRANGQGGDSSPEAIARWMWGEIGKTKK